MRKPFAFLIFSLLISLNHAFSQLNVQNQQNLEFIPTTEILTWGNKLFTYSGPALLSSANHGNSWNLMQDFNPLYVKGLAAWDTSVYALLTDYSSSTFAYKMAILSVNGGSVNIFDCIGIGPVNGDGWGITAFIVKDGILFAGNNNGNVFKSTDQGLHWVNSSNGLITGFNGNYCGQAESVY